MNPKKNKKCHERGVERGTIVSARLSVEDVNEIKQLSEKSYRTSSFIIRCLVRCGLEALQREYSRDKVAALIAFHSSGND